MKLRDLLIAAAVLATLLGVLYWSNHRKPNEDSSAKTSADVAPKILSLNQTDVTGLSIRRKDEPQVDLAKSETGTWQITAPKTLTAEQESVSSMLSALSSLNSERLLEEKATDLASYGLVDPAIEISVSLKGNKWQKLLIGDQTPAGNSFYASLTGDPRVFTMAGYSKTSLDKSLNDLRDKRLFTADFDKVSQIELVNQKPDKKLDITFARAKDTWQILKPKPYRVEIYQADELVRTLREARFDASSVADESKNAGAFKAASPLASVKVTGASGTQELELRKTKSDYYAKSSALSGIYKVPVTLSSSLDKSLDDFRNKKLFDFAYQEPDKIEIHDGAKAYFLTHSGSDWWGPDGKKLDEGSAEALVGKLRDMAAEKFPDSGFGSASVEISVTSDGGKRVEKVSIAKSGDTYVARRVNEPALYELSSSAVAEMEKAAAELKLAPEPKK